MKNSLIKVLHILTDSNIGGAGMYVASYIKNYDASKIDLSVVVPKNSRALTLFEKDKCKVVELDIAPDKSLDFKSIPLLRKLIKKGGFDIVHAHGSVSARLAAKGVCKCVFTKHTLTGNTGALSRLLYKIPGGYAIAVSDAAYKNLAALGFDTSRIYTVYNGADEIGKPTPEQKAECKMKFGVKPEQFVVGCVARFHEIKNHKTFLDAAKKVLEQNKNAAFLMVGDGYELDNMKEYAKKLGIYENCVFTGAMSDTSKAYKAMDAYCICSKQESFGLSLVEAWSAGLPAVTSNADGFLELAKDGETALICKYDDSDAFADSLLKLVNDRNLSRSLGTNGYEQYISKYSSTMFADNITKVYFEMK